MDSFIEECLPSPCLSQTTQVGHAPATHHIGQRLGGVVQLGQAGQAQVLVVDGVMLGGVVDVRDLRLSPCIRSTRSLRINTQWCGCMQALWETSCLAES